MAIAPHATYEGRTATWAETFYVLGDKTRLSIVVNLIRGEQCVTDLAEGLKRKATKISTHLTRLKYCGLVVSTRRGRRIVYRINPKLAKKTDKGFVLAVDGCVFTFPKRG